MCRETAREPADFRDFAAFIVGVRLQRFNPRTGSSPPPHLRAAPIYPPRAKDGLNGRGADMLSPNSSKAPLRAVLLVTLATAFLLLFGMRGREHHPAEAGAASPAGATTAA